VRRCSSGSVAATGGVSRDASDYAEPGRQNGAGHVTPGAPRRAPVLAETDRDDREDGWDGIGRMEGSSRSNRSSCSRNLEDGAKKKKLEDVWKRSCGRRRT